MAVRVIVELRAKPGQRDEVKRLVEELGAATDARDHGYLGSTFYAVLDDPDLLIDIADWASAEGRTAHLQAPTTSSAYAPVLDLLVAPVRAMVITRLPG
jgi:quinol monooxygenase YgiN